MSEASDVFDHHLEAFAAGDIDEILRDYTQDTVMLLGDKSWRGLEGARAFFKMWLEDLIPAGSRFDIIDQQVIDDIVFLTWTAESENYVFEFGTDTFLVHDGKFARQTVATKHYRK